MSPWGRRAILLVVASGVVLAVLGGLSRLGWGVPVVLAGIVDHGPLLVMGVFATVIALERAVALGAPLAYAAPVLSAGVIPSLALGAREVAAWLAVAGAVALVATNLAIIKKQPALFTWLMGLGSLVLALAALGLAALGLSVPELALAWAGFFVCTIVAERLELSRLVRVPALATRVLAALLVIAAGAVLSVPWRPEAGQIAGAALVLVAAWELRFDLASRTIRKPGLPRYVAVAVLLGVVWLGVAGVLLALEPWSRGARYDAILHAVFVGFVLSMVFAHAPIILPAVARVTLPFHAILYAPLALLHVSLALRVAGSLALASDLRAIGGLGNALALALFALCAIGSRWLSRAGKARLA